ncbi:MAG: purine-nucleoside phosphorylase [Planctomycetota bacterium]
MTAIADALRTAGFDRPEVGIVLGSGLGAFVDGFDGARELPFEAVDGMPPSQVPGHAGRFVSGRVAGVPVLALAGRVHLYEGREPEELARAVRAVAVLGARTLVLTNAAGSLHSDWPPGTLMRITDHLNLQAASPLRADDRAYGNPWAERAGAALDAAAESIDATLERGVYAALPGPAYETPAEIRMLAGAGASAVGMSTACEALAGHAAGMEVVGISCITNLAAGVGGAPLDHQEVIDAGREASTRFAALLRAALPTLASA